MKREETTIEEWRVPHEMFGVSRYQVSNMGNVMGLYERVMVPKQEAGSKMSRIVCMTNDEGTKVYYKVHRLVAYTFCEIPEVEEGVRLIVNHLSDTEPRDRASNLEIVTHKENCNKKLYPNNGDRGQLTGQYSLGGKLI